MPSKVVIETVAESDKYDTRYSTRVYVNGEVVGVGHYGGEPEDNSIWRDYAWVEEVLSALAEKLGANVEHTSVEVNE